MELNDLKKNCFRKSEVSDKINSVHNVNEKLVEHGILCLPFFNINDVIDLSQ